MEHKHTNRLIHETSPYLLQHAHNPVDWYAWGDEALNKARSENKPILLSIGYSACHWCHVMERESFENEKIAALMNELFVNIKVDREERPDLDEIYMSAVQVLTGRGGWPMTIFLTSDAKPFYGGTYFPPEDRQGCPVFRVFCRASRKPIGATGGCREERGGNFIGFATHVGISTDREEFRLRRDRGAPIKFPVLTTDNGGLGRRKIPNAASTSCSFGPTTFKMSATWRWSRTP
jgi:hypothetical protein